jgi:hypothetical protein
VIGAGVESDAGVDGTPVLELKSWPVEGAAVIENMDE